MASDINKIDVFKFVALRPPVSTEKKSQETNYISDTRTPEKTPVGELTKTFDSKDGTKIPDQVKSFIEANGYDPNYPESMGNSTLAKVYEFALSVTEKEFTDDYLVKGIVNILDSDINHFLDNGDSTALLSNLWDRYYAFFLLSRTQNVNLDNLINSLRVFHLLNTIAKSKTTDYITFQRIISARPIVPTLFTDLPKPLIKVEQPKEEKPDPEKEKKYKRIWSDLINTHRALEEVKNIRFDTRLTSETKTIETPNKDSGREDKSKLTFVKSTLSVNKQSFDNLHSDTIKILNTLNLTQSNFQIAEPVTQLQHTLENLYSVADQINDVDFLKVMPEEAKSITGLSALLSKGIDIHKVPPSIPPTNVRKSIKPLGIGDLKVVKQKLKKYVAGEVAHIENVLRGEYKERKHRVLDRTENIFTITTETDEETTKDTQTTDRFELKKESEKTIQEQMSVQAGITVSGSYGMVTFGAHGDFAYSTSSQESIKSSSNFAREVVDKSISKIQKKTKEERTAKTLHEVEEINTHGIDNKDKSDHAVGIYRWVDKYYDAQIYNYGKRMMFEFIIPEPAAFYEYAQTHKPKKNIVEPKALPENFTYKNIEIWNIDGYIRDYNVQGITAPPSPYKTISTSIVKDGMPIDGNPHVASSKELVIPAGYISKLGVWFDCSAVFENYPKVEITIGNKIFRPLEISGGKGIMANNHDDASIPWHWFWPDNSIQISVNTYDIASLTINAYAFVELTYEAKVQWQIQTFEKITAAYKAMRIEYEQKLAAQDVQQGIAITGQNPLINREIEKTELKKQCLKMLMDTFLFGSFDAMKDDGTNEFPDFDIFDGLNEGKVIHFFEQAFEWENLTYLFYPYFWARKDQWVHKSNIYDTDPLFTKFLQAGSSRVVIPVRPGYNDVATYYMQTGQIWGKDGNPPLIKKDDGSLNDLFISIADELRNQTDDLEGAKPEDKPWEVVLPTTLVYLQKDADLPTFTI
jgi:hypothetical protein